MKLYYVNKNGKQFGPLTLEQLSTSSLNPTDMVWCDGMPQWMMAKDVDDFKGRFPNIPTPSIPPPFSKTVTYNQPESKSNDDTAHGLIALLVVVVLLVAGYFFYKEYNDRELKEQNPFYKMR